MQRRNFLGILGGAAAWPLVAHAQKPAKLPTIGFLGTTTPATWSLAVAAFEQRLHELGWVAGRTVAMDAAWLLTGPQHNLAFGKDYTAWSPWRRSPPEAYKNAASFGGDANRFYIGGHSSGGHLCGVALVTDWQKDFGLPADMVKGGLCMSGMYDMKPARLSKRSSYVKFTDEMEQAMSSQRQIDKLRAPIIVTYGTNETPEFQRQNRDFAAAVKAAGKPVELIEAANFNHFEMCESLGNPYGPNGRAALKLMKLA
jgi:hypothetical protein